MGWVVFEESTGRAQKYYKKESVAKRICTQHNTERSYDWGVKSLFGQLSNYTYRPARKWAFCSYRDYEGILMGLRGDALKMWQFCNTEIG